MLKHQTRSFGAEVGVEGTHDYLVVVEGAVADGHVGEVGAAPVGVHGVDAG